MKLFVYSKEISTIVFVGLNYYLVAVCPFCSGRCICSSKTLDYRDPDLAREIASDSVDPKQITFGSSKNVMWRCSHGHTFSQPVNRRTDLHIQCPYCSGTRVALSNCLMTRYPELASEVNDSSIKPDEILPNSNCRIQWKCKHGHSWQASVNNRVHGYNMCKVCGAMDYLSLEAVCPDLLPFWDYDHNLEQSPRGIRISSLSNVYWLCSTCHLSSKRSVSEAYKEFLAFQKCQCDHCR